MSPENSPLSLRPTPSDKVYDSWPQRVHCHILTKNIVQDIWKVLYYSVNTLQQRQKERREQIWLGEVKGDFTDMVFEQGLKLT